MLTNERAKIEMNNVEDMKDVANEFDILYYNELLEKRKERERLYEINKNLISQDLLNIKTEVMDRENLKKLREIMEFIEKHDPFYYMEIDKKLFRDVIVDIFDSFYDDLNAPNNSLLDYNLVREALKFISYLEDSPEQPFQQFIKVYCGHKDIKGKLKEHEDQLLGKLNQIVKNKQKRRRQDITRKKKYLTEEIGRELSKTNIPNMNSILENDFLNKKEEDIVKKNNNFDMILNEDHIRNEPILIKQEIKQEARTKLKKEGNNYEENREGGLVQTIEDAGQQERLIADLEGDREENKSNNQMNEEGTSG